MKKKHIRNAILAVAIVFGLIGLVAGVSVGYLKGYADARTPISPTSEIAKCIKWNSETATYDQFGIWLSEIENPSTSERDFIGTQYHDGWIGEKCRIIEVCQVPA